MIRKRKKILLIGGPLVLLSLCCCCAFDGRLEFVRFLLIGWVSFLKRVLPQVRIQWGMVGSAGAYAVVFIICSHYFFRWLHREMPATPGSDAVPVRRSWRWKWTAQIFLLIVLMFVTGLAATGAMRQMERLFGSRQRIFDLTWERRHRRYCTETLERLWDGLKFYADNHHGVMPDSLEALQKFAIDQQHYQELEITYPVGRMEQQPDGAYKQVNGSYLYFGKGMKARGDAEHRAALVVDAPDNHNNYQTNERRGIHILYNDGTIEWLDEPAAADFASKLPAAPK